MIDAREEGKKGVYMAPRSAPQIKAPSSVPRSMAPRSVPRSAAPTLLPRQTPHQASSLCGRGTSAPQFTAPTPRVHFYKTL